MTYQSDPTRWTQSPGDAPELLRNAFDAGTREGPNNLQMRALALKLAAVGGGAAIAAGASTAHASATAGGGALATAGSGSALTLAKLAVSIALVGAAATGAVLWQRGETRPTEIRHTTQQESQPLAEQAIAPTPTFETLPGRAAGGGNGAAVEGAPTNAVAQAVPATAAQASLGQVPSLPEAAEPSVPAVVSAPATSKADDKAVAEPRAARSPRRSERHAVSHDAPVSSPNAAKSGESVAVQRVSGQRQQVSEIDLLRSARAALAARPREAYRLTEEHRSVYPQGVFTQERDALAVEALVRAGDLKLARELAEVFVKRYPSSPHAHRFRESMKLP